MEKESTAKVAEYRKTIIEVDNNIALLKSSKAIR